MKIDTTAMKRHMSLHFLSGRQLSREIGLSDTAVYKILRGDSQPKPETLRKICEVLECTPDDLIKEW